MNQVVPCFKSISLFESVQRSYAQRMEWCISLPLPWAANESVTEEFSCSHYFLKLNLGLLSDRVKVFL